MIKSTKTTLRFANPGKRNQLNDFLTEYRRIVGVFVDLLWLQDQVPVLLPASTTKPIQATTWLSTRALQAAGKQASGIVRGTRKKQSQRLYVYDKLQAEGKYKQARKLKRIIDATQTNKPDIQSVEPELDSRFVKQDWASSTSFDGFITLTSLGNHLKLTLPVKKSKHFNKLLNIGKLKAGVRISDNALTFCFDLPDPSPRTTGTTLGIDVGVLNTVSTSTGFSSKPDNHGHTLDSINTRLARKIKGSKAFSKTQILRTNYINWSINQLNLDSVQTVKLENLKHLRRGRKTSRKLTHFTYTEIQSKVVNRCNTLGVQVTYVSPAYTSQRCSECGWVRSSNRKGKLFKCGQCSFTLDSDLNAARNIATDLRPIGRQERLLHKNRKGFYWK
jgi:IS605 OrfB family transposase